MKANQCDHHQITHYAVESHGADGGEEGPPCTSVPMPAPLYDLEFEAVLAETFPSLSRGAARWRFENAMVEARRDTLLKNGIITAQHDDHVGWKLELDFEFA